MCLNPHKSNKLIISWAGGWIDDRTTSAGKEDVIGANFFLLDLTSALWPAPYVFCLQSRCLRKVIRGNGSKGINVGGFRGQQKRGLAKTMNDRWFFTYFPVRKCFLLRLVAQHIDIEFYQTTSISCRRR